MAAAVPRSDSVRTREQLLDAAERLFAAHGLQAVSLRAINEAAGARNVSAAHYHFGSKERIVAAVVARRMTSLAQERLAALDAVSAAPAVDLRAVVDAVVLPFLRMLAEDTRGADYVTFLARVAGEPEVFLDELAPPEFWTMIQRLRDLLHRTVPHLSERVLWLRVRFVFQQIFVVVTELRRFARRGGARVDLRDIETIGADLVDYLIGGLTAPSRSALESRPQPARITRAGSRDVPRQRQTGAHALPSRAFAHRQPR